MELKMLKTVSYMGFTFVVPEWTQWIATDSLNTSEEYDHYQCIHIFDTKPLWDKTYKFWYNDGKYELVMRSFEKINKPSKSLYHIDDCIIDTLKQE